MDNSLFGTKHIIIMAVTAVIIVGLFFLTRKIKLKTFIKIMLYVGIVSEIIKLFYFITANEAKLGGYLPKTDLPFHLCSIQIILFLILNISSSEKLNRQLLSFMLPSCLFGGIAAILIATDSARSAWVITFQYFLYHAALTVFALCLLTDKEIGWKVSDLLSCFKLLLLMMFIAIYINSIVNDGESNINFMYVVGPPQKGLPYLNDDKGWLSYIIRYAVLIVVCVSLCYIKPIVLAIKERVKGSKNSENA